MKKFLAMLLAMVMMLGCVAFAETVNPDEIPDNVTSARAATTRRATISVAAGRRTRRRSSRR